ncbi:hypothetical protein EXW72_14045 [Pseudomonas sp. BCA14]|nr:hypothetical protein EXW70_17160 [Pseudomonas sp. JMN1]TFF11127.1 hypothetical protein EXW71_15240 [Pseudomonas sp. BCA17]TFF22738.1 hypothetical protein EXW73_20720 [Pseudomonas sp. BCA13]TFF26205.1 hypothetical protein EXW72_14045 [Pseudomonas sp. BCA14]
MLWRGSLLPPGCEAAPIRVTELYQIHLGNRFGSATRSSGSKLPRHTSALLQLFVSPILREPHASTASLQSCTQRLRPHWSLRLACSVRARGGGRV